MSLEGWIFMVGLRVLDIGALIAWLVWFYRQKDEDDDETGSDDSWRSHEPDDQPPVPPSGGDGLTLPLPDAAPWPTRLRERGDREMPARSPARRQVEPHRAPVRSPNSV